MKCRFCPASFDDQHESVMLFTETADGHVTSLRRWRCPACQNWMLNLSRANVIGQMSTITQINSVVYPSGTGRTPAPPEVVSCDPGLARDFKEACEVLPFSPKAAAALARRSLQHIIRSQFGIQKHNLDAEITEVESKKLLTSSLAAQLDAIRNLGNVAAHPMTSGVTGEIIDVEPAEAEWTLDVIEGLFEAVFVGPIKAWKQMTELNGKLAEVNKPPMTLPPVPNGFEPSEASPTAAP